MKGEQLSRRVESRKITPAMHDWRFINLRDPLEDACLKFLPALNAHAAQESAGHLAEECFDEIEPRAMFGGVNIDEAVRPGSEISHGLLRDVGGVIVQKQSN